MRHLQPSVLQKAPSTRPLPRNCYLFPRVPPSTTMLQGGSRRQSPQHFWLDNPRALRHLPETTALARQENAGWDLPARSLDRVGSALRRYDHSIRTRSAEQVQLAHVRPKDGPCATSWPQVRKRLRPCHRKIPIIRHTAAYCFDTCTAHKLQPTAGSMSTPAR